MLTILIYQSEHAYEAKAVSSHQPKTRRLQCKRGELGIKLAGAVSASATGCSPPCNELPTVCTRKEPGWEKEKTNGRMYTVPHLCQHNNGPLIQVQTEHSHSMTACRLNYWQTQFVIFGSAFIFLNAHFGIDRVTQRPSRKTFLYVGGWSLLLLLVGKKAVLHHGPIICSSRGRAETSNHLPSHSHRRAILSQQLDRRPRAWESAPSSTCSRGDKRLGKTSQRMLRMN